MSTRSISYEFLGRFGSLTAGLSAGGRSVQDFGRKLTALDRQGEQMRRGLDDIGAASGRMALAVTAGLAATGKAAVDWGSQWAGVAKTVDGTASQMSQLESELRELARTMPATHEEIAATAEAAGQLGVAREDVTAFTKTMIMLGSSTNLSADEAATAIAQMANVMQTAPEDIDNLGSALVALGNNGASTEAQILDMAQRISGAGAQIGLVESEVLAIANAVASAGIDAEAGGSAVSTALTKMAIAAAAGGGKLADFAEIAGVSSAEFKQMFKDTPAEAFAAFTSGLDRINKSGGDVFSTLKDVGLSDIRVSQAMLAMASSGDMLRESLDLGAKSWDENSALMVEFGKRAGTTASEMTVAWNNVKDAAIDAGAVLLPVLSKASDVLTFFAGTFQALPDPIQGTVTGLLAVTAVLGGAAWFGAKAIGGVTSMKASLASLGIQADMTSGKMARLTTFGKRAGVAVAGLAVAAGAAHGGLGLTNTAMGASLGLIAGPWGAAIGAAGGFAVDLGKGLYEAGSAGERLNEIMERAAGASTLSEMKAVRDELVGHYNEMSKLEGTALFLGDKIGLNNSISDAKKAGAERVRLDAEIADAEKHVAAAMAGVTTAAVEQAARIGMTPEQLEQLNKAALKTAESFVGLGESLDDNKVSLSDWITELEKSAQALLNFKNNAIKAAERGLDDGLIQSLEEAGEAGALRMAQLADATDSEIRRANKAYRRGQAAIDKYKEFIVGIPAAELKVDSSDVETALERFYNLNASIKAFRKNAKNSGLLGGNVDPWTGPLAATSGAQPGKGRADGGYAGAGSKFEKAGTYHAGEVVLPADVVRRDAAFLSARYGNLPNMGELPAPPMQQVRASSTGWGGNGGDLAAAVAQAVAAAVGGQGQRGQLYGDVLLQPHDYSEFVREMEADRRRAAIGGVLF